MLTILHRFFSSLKLSVVLILIIVAGSIIATIIPQGRDIAFYYQSFSRPAARTILAFGINDFFTSLLFLIPSALFFINLLVCSVTRLISRYRKGMKRGLGPDIVHLGLLLLIIGAVISFTGKREGFVYLEEGESVELPNDYSVVLTSFEFHYYQDGRPKDWLSTVTVYRRDEPIIEEFTIEVNKPLRIENMKVYQSSYTTRAVVEVETPSGSIETVSQDHHVVTDSGVFFFTGLGPSSDNGDTRNAQKPTENGGQGPRNPHDSSSTQRQSEAVSAIFTQYRDQKLISRYRLNPGDSFEGYTLKAIDPRYLTGLLVKIDPGVVPVFISLVIIGVGLTWTYCISFKRKDVR